MHHPFDFASSLASPFEQRELQTLSSESMRVPMLFLQRTDLHIRLRIRARPDPSGK